MRKIALFTSKDCPKCKAVKEELKKKFGSAYSDKVQEFDVGNNLEALALLTLMGYMSLPVIAIFEDFASGNIQPEAIAEVITKDV